MAYFVSGTYRVQNTLTMRESRESVFPFLINTGKTDEEIDALAGKIQKRFQATHHSITGDVLYFLGMREEALVEYNTALRIDPEEKNWLNPIWRTGRARK